MENIPPQYPVVHIPFDSATGFHQSFEVHQKEEYTQFFQTYGFVIVDNILTPEEIDLTICEVWDEVESFDWSPYNPAYVNHKCKRNDTSTWDDTHFPTSKEGFFGLDISRGKAAFCNRQNPKLFSVFQTLFGTPKLWVSIDRYGIMRPTVGIPEACVLADNPTCARKSLCDAGDAAQDEASLARKDRPDWKTKRSWLHWDLNPWIWTGTKEGVDYTFQEDFIQENNGSRNHGNVKLQGFINLVDNRLGDGGFSCVPGFNQVLKDYAEKTVHTAYAKKMEKEYAFVEVTEADPMQQQIVNVSLKAGSLLIWSSELPHCNYPNDSQRFRIVQYVKMFESQCGKPGTNIRKAEVKRLIQNAGCEVTNCGKYMLGLEDYLEDKDYSDL